MAQGRAKRDVEIFRPSWILAVLMAVAAILWAAALAILLSFEDVPPALLWGASGFVALFVAACAYYGRSAVMVGPDTVVYRGLVRTLRVTYADIRGLHVLPGPITVYAIRTRRRLCHFTSLFRGHRRLAQLLVERAGLGPHERLA
jgi:hypothetical protein